MNNLRLKTLTLSNFKGFKFFVIDANGGDLSLYGRNGVGKTTVADAFCWILFGKDTLGRSDYEIKTIGADGQVVHYLDHSVEGVFELGGEEITLKRTYKENWVKERGSNSKTFSGHVTAFTVNGVPQSAGEYAKFIDSICKEDQFRLLTDPSRFLSLDWKDRRKMLFDACGDMSDAEVIASVSELKDLGKRIGKLTVADFKKVTDASMKALKDEQGSLPARIDEATRSIPSEDKTDWTGTLDIRRANLLIWQEERAKLNAGGKAAELRSEIVNIESQMRTIESELRTQPDPEREAAIKASHEHQSRLLTAQTNYRNLSEQVASEEKRLSRRQAELDEKRKQVIAEKQKVYSGSTECPSCNRELPEDQVQSAVEAFNLAKAARLDSMTRDGIALKAEVERLTVELGQLKDELAQAEQDVSVTQSQGIPVIPAPKTVDHRTDRRWIDLFGQQQMVQEEIVRLKEDSAHALSEIDGKVRQAQDLVNEAQRAIDDAARRSSLIVRVEELKAREKELAAQYEDLQYSQFLCEQFVRNKVLLLTERINSRFRLTTFRLFKEQINGGLQECCDVLWRENGALPSNGQAVQIGLDIIQTLSEHIGFSAPIWIDNAESVTTFPATNGQQIRLIVSPDDYQLRVVNDGACNQTELTLALN